MVKEIRCAVLGLGRLGYWHAENIASKIQGAKLVKVIDPIEERAAEVARLLKVDAYGTDPKEAFEDDHIDAVIIVTPTSTHGDMIVQAAKHGKHIFVEKPITQTVVQADQVIAAVEAANVVCQVGFMRRFDPTYAEAQRRIAQGDIGKPLYFKAVSRDGNVPHESFIETSGGIFLDVAIHDYDIARFLMNDDVTNVQSTGNILLESNQFMAKYDDVDQGLTTLKFASGAAGEVETMRIAPYGYDIRAEIIGTEGVLQVGSLRQHNVTIFKNNTSSHDLIQDFPTKFKDAYEIEIQHFIHCLHTGEPVKCNIYDGKKALQIAEAATESFKEKHLVQL
ncbi:Gfo/Idh/MocA family oxidoreductase [Lysinibacillus sp. NPDC098008]|uniref:Gfo/Idh/MocA family oxidoreductase n=1 Tax=Lysinibacillus sp. NPDC098008 TaxID=3364146 RepID=UPI003813FDC6